MTWSICCNDRNLASVSEGKGALLSVKNCFGGPYWNISCCNFCMMKSVVLDDVL